MTWMLQLYPRAWRRRYGAEMRELVASERRSFRLFLDLLAGAIDARLDPQPIPSTSPSTKETPVSSILRICASSGFSTTDLRRSAVWMLGGSIGFAAIGIGLQLLFNKTVLSQTFIYAAYPMALVLSGRSTYFKQYSGAARTLMTLAGVLGMFAFFLAVTFIAHRL